MSDLLAESYARCRQFSKQSGSNFLFSFWFLPRAKRKAMFALYAFFRQTDDFADQEGTDQQANLAKWREDFLAAMEGDFRDIRLRALADTIARYKIPEHYFLETIAGVESDLTRDRFDSFDELHEYCYQVASVIGLCCLPVWGVRPDFHRPSAIAAGVAFQLTNILRDIHEDAQRGRIYLPLEDLAQFDVSPEAILSGDGCPEFVALMRFEIERAEKLFADAKLLHNDLLPDGQRIFSAMMQTYHGILKQISQDPQKVLRKRVEVGTWRKCKLLTSLLLAQLPLGRKQPPAMEAKT